MHACYFNEYFSLVAGARNDDDDDNNNIAIEAAGVAEVPEVAIPDEAAITHAVPEAAIDEPVVPGAAVLEPAIAEAAIPVANVEAAENGRQIIRDIGNHLVKSVASFILRVGSIPTLHLITFGQLFWTTTQRKNSRKAQWQAQSRYLCHCAFLISFRYAAGSEKT